MTPKKNKTSSQKALRTALIYGIVAAMWIAFSDPLAASLAKSPDLLHQIGLIKGWVFVAVTTALLFWLLRRDYEALEKSVVATQEQEQLVKNLMESLPVGVWLLDAEGEILHGNAEGNRIWGGAKYVGTDEFEVYKGWWSSTGKQISAQEWGAARAIREGISSLNEEITIEGFDGVRRDILHSAVPRFDELGKPKGAIVVTQDVTELKAIQTSRRVAEEFLSKILDNAPTPIYVVSADGRIRLVNKAWCNLLGRTSEQVVGRLVEQFYSAEIAAQYLENNRQVLEELKAKTVEEYADLPDGRRYYQSVKFPILDAVENRMATAGISIDVTELKQMEGQLQSNHQQLKALALELTLTEVRERRQLSNALHDLIAQPLAMARIRLGELISINSPEECRGLGHEIRTLTDEAIHHVRDLLVEISPPILYELGLEAALRSFAERFSRRHPVKVDFAETGPPTPLTEDLKVLLFQAVRELLVNIVKHSQATRAKIQVQRTEDTVCIVVEDNGRGFSPDWDKKGRFGLFSIKERLRYLGGEMEISISSAGGGKVVLRVSVRPET